MTAELPPTDQVLVAHCVAGDPAALTTLVQRHQGDVFGVCLRITRNPDTALELANGVFYKAYRNLHAYDPGRPLRPWLLRIATNEALNYLRGQRRERDHRVEVDDEAGDPLESVAAADDPVRDVLTAERAEAVRQAVATLPEHYRLLIVLRFFNDLSYSEIAEQTGLPINTIGVQLLRARKLLRRALTGQEGANDESS